MKRWRQLFLTIIILFINILLLAQVYLAFNRWNRNYGRFKIEQLFDVPLAGAHSSKLKPNEPDIIHGFIPPNTVFPEEKDLYVLSPYKKSQAYYDSLLHIRKKNTWVSYNFTDIDGNRTKELPLISINNRTIHFEMWDLDKQLIHHSILEPLSLKLPDDRLSYKIIAIDDIDDDGVKEVIWIISAEFFGLPRGIAVHDPMTGKKKWEFLSGATPFRIIVKDLNKDGKKEITFTFKAPHNNLEYNGMNSDTSYVGVLDCNGNLLWMFSGGGYYTSLCIAVEDIDCDGTFEIITARKCHRARMPSPGHIKVYDALTGKFITDANYRNISFLSLEVINMDRDPELEIVTADSEGGLRISEHNLKSSKYLPGEGELQMIGVEKLHTEKFPYIFTWCNRNTLKVYNNNLDTIYIKEFPQSKRNADQLLTINNGKKKDFILLADQTYLLSSNAETNLSIYTSLFDSYFSLYLGGLFLFDGMLIVLWRQRKRWKNYFLRSFYKDNIYDDNWIPTIQEGLHKMKSPLTAILWETEKLDGIIGKHPKNEQLTINLNDIKQSIQININDLKLMNQFLMRFLQIQSLRFQEIDINRLLSDITDKYKRLFGAKYLFRLSLESKKALLAADRERLEEVLALLIDNALDAMPAGGIISISSSLHNIPRNKNTNKMLCITIGDNGQGICPENRARIFEPYFTTKKDGTGIGLSIARRIVESHKGRIELKNDSPVGTEIALYFPIS